jgi:hypothetical protein
VEKDVAQYAISFAPRGEQVIEAQKPSEIRASRPSSEMDTLPLYQLAYRRGTWKRRA